MKPSGKVFGIGMRKTGTRSVAAATRMLGLRTPHRGGDEVAALVERDIRSGDRLLHSVGEKYRAYFDVEPLVHRFELLDEQYPGSRFVLTTRDVDAWAASLERHVVANRERAAVGQYRGSLLVVEPDAWRQEWAEHHDAVRAYFADRPQDLLELDVCEGGQGWEQLAPFLDRPIPSQPFPWENKRGAGTYRSDSFSHVARRRLSGARSRLIWSYRSHGT